MTKRQVAALGESTVKVGDVVVLKSGGPDMTVTEAGREHAICTWFDEKKAVQKGTFPNDSLRPANDGKESSGSKSTLDAGYDPLN